MSSAPGRLHFVRRLSIPASWLGLTISSGCLLLTVVGVLRSVTDCDTLLLGITEFWDDNAIKVGVNKFFRWLLSPDAMSAEIAFAKSNDVAVSGVVSI